MPTGTNAFTRMERFLRELRFTAESTPDEPDEELSLTVPNLELLGQRLKANHEPFRSESDLRVGMLTAVVSHEDVRRVLDRQQRLFKDRFLFVVPVDEDLSAISWDGQGHVVRKVLLQKAHMFFSGNPRTRDFGLGKTHDWVEAFVEEFKSRKPCIHGSDAHDAASLFEPDQRRYLWIRADATFNGLRQLLHEPETRVYLGESPPALTHVRQHATKYFSQVTISRTADATPAQQWFEGTLPLNHGLIAIIGNKGSGKSALADVLALLGDAGSQPYFSFLTKNRFLAPKLKLGRMFQATLEWQAGPASRRLLSEQIDSSTPERVKYIPQSYLERICSELQESGPTGFDYELGDVIFSHVGAPDRLGHDTLADLLVYRTEEKEAAIEQLVRRLRSVNHEIVALQDATTREHRAELEGRIAQRQEELKAHEATHPAEVPAPSEGSESPRPPRLSRSSPPSSARSRASTSRSALRVLASNASTVSSRPASGFWPGSSTSRSRWVSFSPPAPRIRRPWTSTSLPLCDSPWTARTSRSSVRRSSRSVRRSPLQCPPTRRIHSSASVPRPRRQPTRYGAAWTSRIVAIKSTCGAHQLDAAAGADRRRRGDRGDPRRARRGPRGALPGAPQASGA